ncbi:MAG: hypothetical protein IPK87_01180 [Planctomycetes bacterium]|nr:hypothetical protein [Planctomycetota bacterium]
MFSTFVASRVCAVVSCLALVGLLAGCGGGLRVIKPEIDDAAALRSASAFHVKPVTYDFDRNPEWEISDSDWPIKHGEWSSALNTRTADAAKAVYALGPGAEAKEGAVIELTVTSMNLGTYAFFYKHPGNIIGIVTIKDAKSGNVMFRGSVESGGTTEGPDRFSYEGRIKVAHERVGRDLAWLIDRQE